MQKSKYILLVDTETTINGNPFDVGLLLVNRSGKILERHALIISDFRNEQLFYCKDNEHFSLQKAESKKQAYFEMLQNGKRALISLDGLQLLIDNLKAKYKSVCLTAYNLNFDYNVLTKSGIILPFDDSFCLWHSAFSNYALKRKYKQFCLENHYIGNKTQKGNMTFLTNAEVMAHYITGIYYPEPHTAIEDAEFFELPILNAILKKRKLETQLSYDWRKMQVKDYNLNY